jgi:hypothetical protein
MAKIKYFTLMILAVLQFSANECPIFAQDLSYESDMEYILTNYYILGNYEEVIWLLNRHYSNHQNELALNRKWL